MIKLNGVTIPDYVKVNKVEFSILPSISNNLLEVRGKKGKYFVNQEVGDRAITVSISVIAEEINGVMAKVRDLASWLKHDQPVKLEIADEPDKYYMVVLDGDTTVTEEVVVGQADITFLCVEPYAFGAEKTYSYEVSTDDAIQVNVGGTAETYPTIDLEVKEPITNISVTSANGNVMIGTPASVEETVSNGNKRVLWDEMSSLNGWTTGIGIDGNGIQGTIKTTGYSFKPESWGTAPSDTGWYGSALTKTLPEQLTDFEVQMMFGFSTSTVNLVGRIELYLFDNNNNNIGKIHFSDATSGDHRQNFMARAGNAGTGKMFIEERNYTIWNNMNHGLMRIGRKEKTWYAYIGKWSSTLNRYDCALYKEWKDTKGIALNKLSKIQVHFGAWGKHYAPTATMSIDDIKVINRLTSNPSDVPIIAQEGDVLTIDNTRGMILKNGLPMFEHLQADSKFISFKQGVNGLVISPPSANVAVSFTERWL